MPELPEVETIRRDLLGRILKKKITQVAVKHPKTVKSRPVEFAKTLTGRSFQDIERIGKLLVFRLDATEHILLVHLKMTGQLIHRKKGSVVAGGHSLSEPITDLPNRHTRVVISLADGSELFFNDMRLFGYMHISKSATLEKIRAGYGIEPLTKAFTLERFQDILQRRRTSIKAVLLNQNIISGIGNIYADEACFRAGVRPSRSAHRLTRSELAKLHRACEETIRLGIKHRGTTFNNFVDADGRSGGFLKLLRVYGRDGENCRTCRSAVIQKTRVAGRGTHFCPVCQK